MEVPVVPIIALGKPARDQLDVHEVIGHAFGFDRIEQVVIDHMDEDGAGVLVALLVVGSARFVDVDGQVPCVPIVMTYEAVREMITGLTDTLAKIDAHDFSDWEASNE